MQRVILCDIDGTLVNLRRDFVWTLITQIFEDFGLEVPDFTQIKFAGQTDYSIFHNLLAGNEGYFEELRKEYISAMKNRLESHHIHLVPHARQLLSYLKKQGYGIGLLTGNFEEVAGIKLRRTQIYNYFHFGAFGGVVSHRNELAGIAQKEAERHLNTPITPNNMIIIGDTPEDIACAKNYGAKSVAVTTGSYGRVELAQHKPDQLLESLEHPERWLPRLF